ncbi:MAG: hypothetical protein ACC634_06850, partial [Hyphomicrobiales bacterium]
MVIEIPDFVGLKDPKYIDFLKDGVSQLEIKRILSPDKNKLPTLVSALHNLNNQPGLIFCNFKDTIKEVSEHLLENHIDHGC